MNMKSFEIYFILILLIIPFNAQSQFNKEDAILWLNSKMDDAGSVEPEEEMIFSQPYFSGCTFSNKVWLAKFAIPEPITMFTNTYNVSLAKLNPNDMQIHYNKGKFYYDVPTTNSAKIIEVYYSNPNTSPYVISKYSSVRIGPFNEGENLEKRVKDVLFKLIKSCGGKGDTF
jgi:hypothetical protein